MRAVAVSVTTTLLAVACHAAAGGMATAPATVVAVLAVATPLCFWLSDRRWSAVQLTAMFLLGQGMLHLLSIVSTGDSLAHTATLDMAGWHLFGTAVSVVAVRHGEACLWATVRVLGLRLALLPAAAPILPRWPTPRRPVCSSRESADHQFYVAVTPARGPPH